MIVALAAIGGAWFWLAPPAVGGSTSYVVTAGVSMQPRFHTGDLALVRGRSDYRVGDVVAYRSRALHTIVLHRIVARDGGRFVFKGDNNNFLDPERPTRGQLLGKLWLRVPRVGETLRTPRLAGLLACVAALLFVGGGAGVTRRRRRRRRDEDARPTPRGERPAGGALPWTVAIAAGVLVASLALATLAHTRPTHGPTRVPAAYTQTGTFSYNARAPVGAVYRNGRAWTGDPLFSSLVDRIDVRFHYHLIAQSEHTLRGSVTLEATIASSSGWNRTLALQHETPFNGDDTVATGSLHLHAIERLLRRVEHETGTTRAATYTLTLSPHVRIDGQLASANLHARFTPQLPFTLDALHLQAQLPASHTTANSPGSPQPANPLHPAGHGTVTTIQSGTRTFSLHAINLTVQRARELAVLAAALALVALVALLALALRNRTLDEPALIAARYRQILIPVARTDRRSYDEIIEVTTIETLARLATRYDRLILHEHTPLGHSYRIADEGILYIYLIGDPSDLIPPLATHTQTPDRPPQQRRETRRPRWWNNAAR